MIKKLKNFYIYFKQVSLNSLSGSLAFFFLLTILPLVFIISLILNKIPNVSSPEIFVGLTENVASVSIIMILSTLLSITKIFKELRNCGQIIYHFKKESLTGIKGYIKTIIYSVILIILISALIILNSLINLINLELFIRFKTLFNAILLFIIIFILLTSLNFFACPKKVPFKYLIRGSMLSTILMYIITFLYFTVFSHSSTETIYGALATFVILLSYLYILSKLLVFGMIFNSYLIRNKSFENKI